MLDKIPDKIDSKFRYVLLAAERAEQMMVGAPPKVEMAGHKLSRVAMEEVTRELIDWDYGPPPETETEIGEASEAAAPEATRTG